MAATSGGTKQTRLNTRSSALIVAILVGAAALRLWGLPWGLPDTTHLFSYHPDEYHSLRGLFSLAQGSLNPHFFNYGSLYLYLVAAAAVIAHGSLLVGVVPRALTFEGLPEAVRLWTLDARIVSVLAAILTVIVVYWLARRVLGNSAALVACAFLATMPLHVLHSHYGTVDITQALFVSLCLLFSVRIVQQRSWQACLWAGIMAGLAASTKYNGAAVIVAPLVAIFLPADDSWSHAGDSEKRAAKLLAIVLGAAAAFLLTSPYTLLAWNEARGDIIFEIQHMRLGEPLAILAESSGLLFHLKNLLAPGAGLVLILAIIGAVIVVMQRRRQLYPLVVFAILWSILISLAKVRYARYEVPLLPVLAVLGAMPVAALINTSRAWRGLGYAIVVVCLGLNLMWSVQVSAGLADNDPRAEILPIVLDYTPPQAMIGVVQEPWFDIPPVDYCNGGKVIRSLPLWHAYHRPVREIVVTGLNAAVLKNISPHTFVLSEFTVRDGLWGGDPQIVGFMGQLLLDYQRQARGGGLPLTAVPWEVSSDWLYPWPEIQIYVRQQLSK